MLRAAPPVIGWYTQAEFPIGKEFTWWRFSSCTTDGEVLKNPMFLGQSGERTLFSIDLG